LFKPVPLNVAFLRGTTADEDGNVTMERKRSSARCWRWRRRRAARAASSSCRSSEWRAARRSRRSRSVFPAFLVDFVVVDPEQRQTYATYYDPSYSGELRIPVGDIRPLPFGPRKVIVRRAAMELFPGAICNLGAGVSTGLSTIAAEEGLLDAVHLTNEQGIIGGAPITGRDSGGGQNFAAMIEQPRSSTSTTAAGSTSRSCRLPKSMRRQRQCQPVRRQDHRRRRLHQHRAEREVRRLRRHADGGRARHRLGERPYSDPQGRAAPEVRLEARAGLLQRGDRAREGPGRAVRDRTRSLSRRADGLELIEIAPGLDASATSSRRWASGRASCAI
jgi:hypothetical protein